MNLIQAIQERHAVRHFDNKVITGKKKKELIEFINKVNKKYKMHIQLVTNEPKAFGGAKAAKCNFTGCKNYLAIVGKEGKDLAEKAGYVGEMVVLKAQQLGLNTCWVVLTYDRVKDAFKVNKGEKVKCVIAIGKGTTKGKPHVSKKFEQVCPNKGKLPKWFTKGVEMALLAPTGINQQAFKITLLPKNTVSIKNKSFCRNIDLGIIKYHFEIGAGKDNFSWK